MMMIVVCYTDGSGHEGEIGNESQSESDHVDTKSESGEDGDNHHDAQIVCVGALNVIERCEGVDRIDKPYFERVCVKSKTLVNSFRRGSGILQTKKYSSSLTMLSHIPPPLLPQATTHSLFFPDRLKQKSWRSKSRKAHTMPMKSRNKRKNLRDQNPGRRDHQSMRLDATQNLNNFYMKSWKYFGVQGQGVAQGLVVVFQFQKQKPKGRGKMVIS
ncbi:hypothetical protein JHK84_027831 [Glycine max]|nr:hypothetical protein JHK84_027831 [Glycine max]